MEDRVIGTFMGQAVGDALGTTYEFSSGADAERSVQRHTTNGHLQMVGAGPFGLLPGQVTDDTELALMVARRLAGISEVGVMYVAQGFVEWLKSRPFDIGSATRTAFGRIPLVTKDGTPVPIESIYTAMQSNALQNESSLSNGCLMKISPLAVYGVLPTVRAAEYSDEEIANIAGMICALTNPNPIAVDASRVYVLAIRDAIRGFDRKEIWAKAVRNAKTTLIQRIVTDAGLRATPAVAENRAPIPVDGGSQGYLGVALQLAFYELLHSKTFEEALTRTVARGGDADTNGCIVGALVGAFYGYSDIPGDWSRTVLQVQNPRAKKLIEVETCDLLSLALTLGYRQ